MAETLELQIKSTADQAAKSIGNLESKLRSLGGALSSINGSNLHSFSSGLSELATSIRSLSGIDTRTFTKVSQNMQKLGTLDSSKLVSSASALSDMSRQLSAFSGLAKQSQNITTLIQSISKLGGKSATNAADNIRNLGSALKEVMATLSNAPTVSDNIIQMTNALANLANQGSKVGSASRSLTANFSSVTKSAKTTKSGFGGLASAFGKFYATYFLAIRAIGKLGDAVDLSSQLTEVQNVVDTTFGNMTSKVDEFTKTSIQDFGMSELTAKQISSRFQAMGTAVGITSSQVANGTKLTNDRLKETQGTLYTTSDSMADMSLNLTKLAADMASFYDVDQEDVAKSLQSVFTGTTAPLRRYGLDLTQATLKEWALKNGIDADISSMTQAEKVLLRYQYVMANTTAAQGDFAKTADTWANSVRTLKQEIEAWGAIIGSVIINALKPFVQALNQVMLKVISFTRTVADALGAIFGWTVEISGAGIADDMEDVADSTGDIGSNASDADKKAKQLKKTLLSIDQIHALEDNSGSSSGSGSGSGTGTSTGGADSSLKKVGGLVEKYKSSIKDLYELGSYIGNAIADSLESIDWQKIYKKADNFGKGLADFLNGLISPRLFYDLGQTIAGSLNTALHFLNSFGTTFDWTNFGNSIAAGINGFFENYDFALLGQTITAWARGILKAITTAVEKVDWANVGSQIGTFFANIDWESAIGDLHKLIEAIAKAIVVGMGNWMAKDPLSATIVTGLGIAKLTGASKKVGDLLSNKLSSVSAKVGLVITAEGLSMTFDSNGFNLNSFVAPLMTGIGATLLAGGNWQIGISVAIVLQAAEVGLRIGNLIAGTDLTWGEVFKELSDTSWWADLGHYAYEDLFKGLFENTGKAAQSILEWVGNLFVDFINGNIIPWVNDLRKLIGLDAIEPLKRFGEESDKQTKKNKKNTKDTSTAYKNMGAGVSSTLSGIGRDLKTSSSKMDSFNSTSSKVTRNITSNYSGLNSKLSSSLLGINNSIGNTQSKMNDLSGTASTSSSNARGSFSSLNAGVSSYLNGVNSSLLGTQGKMSSFQTSAQNMSSGASNSFSAMASNASSKLSSTGYSFNGLKGNIDNANGSLGTFNWYAGRNYSIGVSSWGFDSLKSSINGVKSSLDALFTYNNKKFNITTGNKYVGYKSLLDMAPKGYATGGFPNGEDGLFYANHNELVGKFSNGKTAVANNEQITEGIKRAVVDGMMQVAMATSTQSSTNAAPIIENTFKVDSETLYRMTQKGKAKHNQRYIVATEIN